MNIRDIIGDKETVILAAMKNPAVAPKRKPTIEQALKSVASEVEFLTHQRMSAEVEPKLQDVYDMYVIMNGDHDDLAKAGDNTDDYESGLDDEVEKALEPYEAYLSADWLGRNTIDTRLWEEGAVPKLAQSVGEEVFKSLSYRKTPAQVLSNAGIVQKDVEIYFEQHVNKTPEQEKAMAEDNELSFEEVAAKIKLHLGGDFDVTEVYADIELACDDDEILAQGAGKRLGVDDKDLGVIQMATLIHGDETANELYRLVNEAEAKKGKKGKPKASRKPAAKPKNAEDVEGALNPTVLKLLKAHSAAKDTEIASELGFSRATYNNYVNGKSPFTPDGEQYATLRVQIVGDVNGLLEALSLLDGTERMEIA